MANEMVNLDAVKGMARARKMIHDDAKNDSHIIKERVTDRERTYKSLKGVAAPIATGFDNIAPSYGSNGNSISSIQESYNDDSEDKLYAAFDNKMKQVYENRQQPQIQMSNSQSRQINKNLPKEILESFSKNFIDTSAMNTERPVLDRIGLTQEAQPQTNVVAEDVSYGSSAKIDYELIKNIVEGCVKKYVNALGKKMLTENKENNGEIKAVYYTGNKFKFIDSAGNIYESKLVKAGNVKNIKD